jgi:hypothetical protein
MEKAKTYLAIVLLWASVVAAASAQSDIPWNGPYIGVNTGEARSSTCSRSILASAASDSVSGASFADCPGARLVGGFQIGENFQNKRLVWGVGADIDIWNSKSNNQLLKYTGALLPPGNYAYSGKLSPNDFAILGTRIGYAGDTWLPYLRVGAIITTGPPNSIVNFTPTGATKPTAAFSGGNNFNSAGWVTGGGTEIGLNGAWSITLDYLHVNLGSGTHSTTTCTGTASACTPFSGVSLDSSHRGFTANILRIGVNFWFGYWEP